MSEEQQREEREVAQLLRAAGPRAEPPNDLRQAWEQQFRRELEPVLARRRRKRLGILSACGTAAAALLVALWLPSGEAPAPGAELVHSRGEVIASNSGAGSRTARRGDTLHSGQELATAADSYAALRLQHHEMRLQADTRITLSEGGLTLHRGSVYLASTGQGGSIRVQTPHATIEDVGTQFMVTLLAGQTVARVRQGQILVDSGSRQALAAASASAQRLRVDESRQIEQRAEPIGDEAWHWIHAAAPPFQLEGSSAWEFLRWAEAETGLSLRFETEAAEIYARSTLLHGSIGTITPTRAIAPVLAATDLRQVSGKPSELVIALQRN